MNLGWRPVFPGAAPPIFTRQANDRVLFYTPGWVVAAGSEQAQTILTSLTRLQGVGSPPAAELMARAIRAEWTWKERPNTPYRPVCLTLYLTNACNLACLYCFAQSGAKDFSRLPLRVVKPAAELVAEHCQVQGCPLTLVLHGGGEPTLYERRLVDILDLAEETAARHHIPIFRYLATNGVMAHAKAARVVKRFDLVGLSCDGPPEIQNQLRPFPQESQQTSAWYVERTAGLLHALQKPFHVRVTVTPDTYQRQPEIAEYICTHLAPETIHVEPVYTGGRTGAGSFSPDAADAYHAAFLEGRAVARGFGIPWKASGSRPGEIHGSFCQVFRNVLNLTPEGTATACFKYSRVEEVAQHGMAVSAWQVGEQKFSLDTGRAAELCEILSQESAQCMECFNRYHCARHCPDSCSAGQPVQDSFRCRTQALLANQLIIEAAESLCAQLSPTHPAVSGKVCVQ